MQSDDKEKEIFCCFCGVIHENPEDCWLKSEEANEILWKPLIKRIKFK